MTTTNATTTLLDLANIFQEQATPVASQAVDSGRDLWFSFLGIDWSNPTWDVVILLFFIISVLIYSFTLGRDRIVAILVSTYLAWAVAINFPYTNELTELIKQSGIGLWQVSSFLIVFILLFFFLSRSRMIQGLSTFGGSWWQVIIFSLLQVGLMTSIILSLLSDASLTHLSPFTKIIFLDDLGRFCWTVLPILALVFFDKKPRRKRRQALDDFDI